MANVQQSRPSESSDEDSISLTSTIQSEGDGEYEVDCILAEEPRDGVTIYLTRWAGYPEKKASWEPLESFNDPSSEHDALEAWSKKKQRIANHEEEPFNVKAWVQGPELRKARREKKRARRARRAQRKPSSIQPSLMKPKQQEPANAVVTDLDTDDSDAPLVNRRRSKQVSNKADLMTEKPIRAPTKQRSVPTTQPSTSASPVKKPYTGTARLPPMSSSTRIDTTSSRNAGTTRGSASISNGQRKANPPAPALRRASSGIDVTANWSRLAQHPRRRRRSSQADKDKPPKMFSLSRRHSELMKLRDEPAPNSNSLRLINPKTGAFPIDQAHAPIAAANPNHVGSYPPPARAMSGPRRQPTSSVIPADPRIGNASWNQAPVPTAVMVLKGKDKSSSNAPSSVRDNPAPRVGSMDPRNGRAPQRPAHIPTAGLSAVNPKEGSGHDPASEERIDPRTGKPPRQPPSLPIAALSTAVTTASTSKEKDQSSAPPANAPTGPRSHRLLEASAAGSMSAPSIAVIPGSAKYLPPSLMAKPSLTQKIELRDRVEAKVVHCRFNLGSPVRRLGKIRLAGFDSRTKKRILSVRKSKGSGDLLFDFKRVCTAMDYRRYFPSIPSTYYGSGFCMPRSTTQRGYDSVAHLLGQHRSVAMHFAREYTMLIWPANASVWGFLDDMLQPVPEGTILRFAIRRPFISELSKQIERSPSIKLQQEDRERYKEICSKIESTPTQKAEKAINIVFRDLFEIEFDRLITPNGPQTRLSAKNFFLCFIPAGCERYQPNQEKRRALRWMTYREHDLFVEFLKANGAENIYSMQEVGSSKLVKNGAWDCFTKTVTSGVVVIHDRCGRPDQLPHLGRLLRYGGINVWETSLAPIPSFEYHPHLVRLYPHGGVILLTASLILYKPYEALRIIYWFRLVQLPAKLASSWKLAMYPRIKEWLLQLQKLGHEETRQTRFGYPMEVLHRIYSEVCVLLERDEWYGGQMVEEWDKQVPSHDARIVSEIMLPRSRPSWTGSSYEDAALDHDAIQWNDDALLLWFSEWADGKRAEYRKFQVVLGYSKDDEQGDYVTACYRKGYGYLKDGPYKPSVQERGICLREDGTPLRNALERNTLDIMPYGGFHKFHKISDQSVLDQKWKAWESSMLDGIEEEKARAEESHRSERMTAKRGLEHIMQISRDNGGTEADITAAGRYHLLVLRDEHGMASAKEVRDCAIDMDFKPFNHYEILDRILDGTTAQQDDAMKENQAEIDRQEWKTSNGLVFKGDFWRKEVEKLAREDVSYFP